MPNGDILVTRREMPKSQVLVTPLIEIGYVEAIYLKWSKSHGY
jgi:hypothetical protein